MPAQLTELKVRDVAVKLHRAGSGPKVLFLHGAGGVPQWVPFFDALSVHYDVIVPEHPGFGGSDDPRGSNRYQIWRCSISISSRTPGSTGFI